MYIFFICKKQGNVYWSYMIFPMNYWKFWFSKFLIFQKFISNPILLGFPGGLKGKASACNAGDPGSIPESGRSPGEGNGNPLQYSCLENPMGGCSRWGRKESDTTKWLHFTSVSRCMFMPCLHYPLICRWIFRLFPCLGCYEECCYECMHPFEL